jgi:hypothetical protein
MDIGFHVKYELFLSDFNGTWIFVTDFRDKCHEKSSSGRPSSFMRKDGHDEANSCFSQFCERAQKKKKVFPDSRHCISGIIGVGRNTCGWLWDSWNINKMQVKGSFLLTLNKVQRVLATMLWRINDDNLTKPLAPGFITDGLLQIRIWRVGRLCYLVVSYFLYVLIPVCDLNWVCCKKLSTHTPYIHFIAWPREDTTCFGPNICPSGV